MPNIVNLVFRCWILFDSFKRCWTWFWHKLSPVWFFLGLLLSLVKATSCQGLTHWKRLWYWEGLGAGEGDNRGWDGWMASPTWWTWVWVNSRSWWWTGRPGVLQFMGSQRVGLEFEWTPGVGDGQEGLACCSLWGREELDMTERLNWLTELKAHLEQPSLVY